MPAFAVNSDWVKAQAAKAAARKAAQPQYDDSKGRYWDFPFGTWTIRFLPPADASGEFLVWSSWHYRLVMPDGGLRTLICLRDSFGLPCPVCEAIAQTGNKVNVQRQVAAAKASGNIIIRQSGGTEVKIGSFNDRIATVFLETANDLLARTGAVGFVDPYTGWDWTVEKIKTAKGKTTYPAPRIIPVPCGLVEGNVYDPAVQARIAQLLTIARNLHDVYRPPQDIAAHQQAAQHMLGCPAAYAAGPARAAVPGWTPPPGAGVPMQPWGAPAPAPAGAPEEFWVVVNGSSTRVKRAEVERMMVLGGPQIPCMRVGETSWQVPAVYGIAPPAPPAPAPPPAPSYPVPPPPAPVAPPAPAPAPPYAPPPPVVAAPPAPPASPIPAAAPQFVPEPSPPPPPPPAPAAGVAAGLPECYGKYKSPAGDRNCVLCPLEVVCQQRTPKTP